MIYEILLPYFDSKNQVQFCFVRFKIDKHKRIKVTEFQAKPQSILIIPQPHDQFFDKLPRMEKGKYPIDFVDIENILKDGEP